MTDPNPTESSEFFGQHRPVDPAQSLDRAAADGALAASETELQPVGAGPPVVLTVGCAEAHAALVAVGLDPRAVTSQEALARIHRPDVRALLVEATEASKASVVRARLYEFVKAARREAPLTEVLVWAPGGSAEVVRGALQSGAADVVLVPTTQVVAKAVQRTIESQRLLPRLQRFDLARSRSSRFEGLVSRSGAMWELFQTLVQVAPTGANVLILGETGTGKELLARAIHKHSGRSGRFVAINCGAVPENLVDSELFGHEEGAFTGASSSKEGLFRHADGGTLFLDEVGNLPLSNQFSLLRALQEGTVRPVGGTAEVPVDVRVIAATSVPLDDVARTGQFREDLFYRLDVIRLVVPPLRARAEDVIHLFGYFRRKLSKQYRVEPPRLTDGFLEALLAYSWPGNVRELENLVERLVLTQQGQKLTRRQFTRLMQPYGGKSDARSGKPSGFAELPAAPVAQPAPLAAPAEVDLERGLEEAVAQAERRYLEAALRRHRGRIQATADTARVSPRTLLRKLRRHGLDKRDFR
ncbi:MAG: sigma-54-dependent Fis family transcriptional regulator [Planctomycetes bacterium]|nr:sigma-54-dependent Fis family transcriptional regulator [Planctomycetota bacterium]